MFMVTFLFILTVSFTGTGMLYAREDKIIRKTESHDFRLLEAPGSKKDPYSINYPIKVEGIGKIRVIVHIKGGKIKRKKPFRIWIIDARGNKKNTRKVAKKYRKKSVRFKKKGKANYAVDSGELYRTGGKYIIMLSNLSKVCTARGTIAIMYSVKEKKQDGKRRKRRHK